MELDTIGIIIQGGAVGIAIFVSWILWKTIRMMWEMAGNHISHSTEAIKELTVAITKLVEHLEHFKK